MTRVGTKKTYFLIKPELERLDIKCGRDKLHDILRSEGMLIKKKKNYMRTTNSYHRFYKYPNLITDAYSKQIVGYQLSDNLKTINCINALKTAIKNRKYPDRPLIHHSDRGFQYCSPDYIEALEKNNIGISMTTKHDPYENAVAERVNGTLKNEFDLGDKLPDQKNAERELNKAVWIYNNLRPHESCNYLTPFQTHNQESLEIKKWPVRFRKKQIKII